MSGEMIDADDDVAGENLNPRARGRLWVIARDGKRRLVANTCGGCGELVRVGEPHSHRRVPPPPRKCRVTIVGMTSDAWDDLLRTYLDALAEAVANRPPVVYDVNHGRDQEPQADADRLPATG
jgi:hypothetical protein